MLLNPSRLNILFRFGKASGQKDLYIAFLMRKHEKIIQALEKEKTNEMEVAEKAHKEGKAQEKAA